jgi:hypothetical protein
MADPNRSDVRGVASFYIVLSVADHPNVIGAMAQFFAGKVEGRGIGFEWGIFAGDEDVDRQLMPGEDRLYALSAVAGNQGDGNCSFIEPMKQLAAAGVERGIGGGGVLMAAQNGLGGLAGGEVEARQGFEDGRLADAHFGFDTREIEHGFGQGAVHVKEKSSR